MIAKVSVEIDGKSETAGTVVLHVVALGDETKVKLTSPRGSSEFAEFQVETSDLIALGRMLSAVGGRSTIRLGRLLSEHDLCHAEGTIEATC